jgi:ABC-type lipoprotein release transport system permease subunit
MTNLTLFMSMAWRNLWRNRRRTLITAGALAFGFLGSVVMIGISDGFTAELVENGTGLLTGQVQIHARGYRPERSMYETIGGPDGADIDSLLATADATPGITAAAPRVYGGGIVSAGDATEAVGLFGVDPAREARVSRVLGAMVEGRAPRDGAREMAVGAEVARRLDVRPGAQVVVVAPAADGSMGNDLFTVSGVFRSGLGDLDAAFAVLPIGALQTLLGLEPGRIHEIAMATAVPSAAPDAAARLAQRLAPSGLDIEVVPWEVFSPEIAAYVKLAEASNGLIVAIVFVFAIFGVANTMLMGTFERRREFAVVRALGTVPSGVALTVLFEGLALGLLSLAAGAVLTAPVLAWLHHAPLNLTALVGDMEFAGALIRPVLRAEYSVSGPVLSAAGLLVTALLAALYPAIRAARVPPADALAGR